MPNYVDVLLVEIPDGTLSVVTAPSQEAVIGDIVCFNGGRERGIVKKIAWFESKGSAFQIICRIADVYDAEKIYRNIWNAEAGESNG